MKNLKWMMLALFTWVCTIASAQSDFFPYGKNSFMIGYANLAAENSEDPVHGARLSYAHIFELSESVPVFFEAGALFQYAMMDGVDVFQGKGIRTEFSLGYLSVPLNVGYQFNIGETGLSIAPKAGLNVVYNVLANYDVKMNDKTFELNWFDDVNAKRFNIGWQAGVDVAFKQLVLGVVYGQDFSSFVKDGKVTIGQTDFPIEESKWKRFCVSLGYRF